MQKILSINETKVYSRKQVIGWVKFNGFVFEQLKNGLFFLKILRKLIPNDVSKHKIYEKAINVYEQTQNMNIVKKILNKHNLQLNLNVQSIVTSKNCFQLANWFKNLYDQNKSDKDTEYNCSEKSRTPSKIMQQIPVSITNYKSLTRATSSNRKKESSIKKINRVTSGFVGINKQQVLNYTMKLPKQSFDSQTAYRISAKMNQTNEKIQQINQTLRPSQLRILSRSRSRNSKLKGSNWLNSPLSYRKGKKVVQTQQQKLINLMKIQSLQEQIGVYDKMLKKISKYIKQNDKIDDMQKIRKQIIKIIYKTSQKQIGDSKQNEQIQTI